MRKLSFLALLCMLTTIQAAFALQVKMARDDTRVNAVISAKEISRIFVYGDRIQSTKGINGAYELMKDEKIGAIYLRPTAFYQKRAFNLFLTTELGHTFNLFLVPQDVPAESLEIKPLSAVIQLATHWEMNSPYVDKLVLLLKNMTNDVSPEGYAVIEIEHGKTKKWRNGLSMQLLTLYQGGRLQGEVWLLKNEGKKEIHLNPQYFFEDSVRALSLEDEILSGYEETTLYRIVSHD